MRIELPPRTNFQFESLPFMKGRLAAISHVSNSCRSAAISKKESGRGCDCDALAVLDAEEDLLHRTRLLHLRGDREDAGIDVGLRIRRRDVCHGVVADMRCVV